VVATIAAIYRLPETPSRPAGTLDLTGLARLGLGVPAIVFALAEAEATNRPLSASVLIPLLAGTALVCDFIRHAIRAEHPLLDLGLFARRTFATGSVALFCFNVAWFGTVLLLPLYFQQVLHASPERAGLLLAPEGIGTAVGMWVSGRIRDHLRTRQMAAAGVFGLAVTTLMFARMGTGCPTWLIWVLLFVSGVGGGFAWVAGTAAGYVDLDPDRISHAAPLVATMMRLGASFGTALAAIVLQRELNLDGGSGSPVHLLAAYHSAFAFAVTATVLALVMFIALCRRAPQTATQTHHTAEFESVAAY
jgi:predicted MFS family arabinose efflux permease